jgi:hypothetical protein
LHNLHKVPPNPWVSPHLLHSLCPLFHLPPSSLHAPSQIHLTPLHGLKSNIHLLNIF